MLDFLRNYDYYYIILVSGFKQLFSTPSEIYKIIGAIIVIIIYYPKYLLNL